MACYENIFENVQFLGNIRKYDEKFEQNLLHFLLKLKPGDYRFILPLIRGLRISLYNCTSDCEKFKELVPNLRDVQAFINQQAFEGIFIIIVIITINYVMFSGDKSNTSTHRYNESDPKHFRNRRNSRFAWDKCVHFLILISLHIPYIRPSRIVPLKEKRPVPLKKKENNSEVMELIFIEIKRLIKLFASTKDEEIKQYIRKKQDKRQDILQAAGVISGETFKYLKEEKRIHQLIEEKKVKEELRQSQNKLGGSPFLDSIDQIRNLMGFESIQNAKKRIPDRDRIESFHSVERLDSLRNNLASIHTEGELNSLTSRNNLGTKIIEPWFENDDYKKHFGRSSHILADVGRNVVNIVNSEYERILQFKK